jgi:hypothetical protein
MKRATHHMFEALEPRRLLDGVPDDAYGYYIDLESPTVSYYTRNGHIERVFSTFEGKLPTEQYKATVDWGDGTIEDASIILQDDGRYGIAGSHDYAQAGEYDVYIHVTSSDGGLGTDFHIAWTHLNPLGLFEMDNVWVPVNPTPIDGARQIALGRLIDLEAGSADQYTLTIDWGDGTTSAGSLHKIDAFSFFPLGSHTYEAEGEYQVSFTISKNDPSTAPVEGTLTAVVGKLENPPLVDEPDMDPGFGGPSGDEATFDLDPELLAVTFVYMEPDDGATDPVERVGEIRGISEIQTAAGTSMAESLFNDEQAIEQSEGVDLVA